MSVYSSTTKTSSKNYQPGVDGLRTVAVMLVILYHVGFNFFSGGFIGVDVFFVISGYLITGILNNQVCSHSFSYLSFLASRISRLYPALLFTVSLVMLFCFLTYSSEDFESVASSSIPALLSSSNIFFANTTGYFDTSSDINPLLHTWSLSVEQQFYLAWPLLLLAVLKINAKAAPTFIFLVSILSLILSQMATKQDPTNAYYLLQYRVFELGFGGLTYYAYRNLNIPNRLKELFLSGGLIIIVLSSITINSSTQFPGVNAFIPVMGAILCIISHDAKYVGKLINNKVFVATGIASYSIYLIHWPLIVFYKYWIFREINNIERVAIIISSIVIGFFMYSLIENKYRKINLLVASKKRIIFASSFCILTLLSYSVIHFNGYDWRSNHQYAEENKAGGTTLKQNAYGGDGIKQNTQVLLGKSGTDASFVVMGDSYSRQYANAISNDLLKSGMSAIGFFSDGCFFSEKYKMVDSGKVRSVCLEMTHKATQYAKIHNIPLVYAQSWTNYIDKLIIDNKKMAFSNEVDYINFNIENVVSISKEIYPLKLYVIGTPPPSVTGINSSVASCSSRPDFLPMPCRKRTSTPESVDPKFRSNNIMSQSFKSIDGINFINPYKYLCRDGKCNSIDSSGGVMYFDSTHLSFYGARKVWQNIRDEIITTLK